MYDIDIIVSDKSGNITPYYTQHKDPLTRGDLFRTVNNLAVAGETLNLGFGQFDTGVDNYIQAPKGVDYVGRGRNVTELMNGWPDQAGNFTNFENSTGNHWAHMTMTITSEDQTVISGWSKWAEGTQVSPAYSKAWYKDMRFNCSNFGPYVWGGYGNEMYLDDVEIYTTRWGITAGSSGGGKDAGRIFAKNFYIEVQTSQSPHGGGQGARGFGVAIRGMGTYLKNGVIRVTGGSGWWYDPMKPGGDIDHPNTEVPMTSVAGIWTANSDNSQGDVEAGNYNAEVEIEDVDILVNPVGCPDFADIYERMPNVIKLNQYNVGSLYSISGNNRLRSVDFKTQYYTGP